MAIMTIEIEIETKKQKITQIIELIKSLETLEINSLAVNFTQN